MRRITQNQRENIVLNAAILVADYGEATAREIGITKGGVKFTVTETVRDIEFDGRRGKTKGMEVVDEVDAAFETATLELSQDNILLALVAAAEGNNGEIVNTDGGVIPDERYLKNVTAFGICNKTSKYKKITLYNPGAAGGLEIATSDKNEATVPLKINAHWDMDVAEDAPHTIYKIEDDTTGPGGSTGTLRALTVRCVAGTTGKTVVNVVDAIGSNRGLVYSIGAAAEDVDYDDDLSAWDSLISGEELTASAAQIVTVAEVDAERKARGAGSATVAVG